MDSEQLIEELRNARSEASNASDYAQSVVREAGYAESSADDAYNAIDSIIDSIVEFNSINVQQHKSIINLSFKVAKVSAYLHVLLKDGADGDGISEKDENSLRDIGKILDRLFKFDYDTQAILGLSDEYYVGYEYGTVSYTISPVVKGEANNV